MKNPHDCGFPILKSPNQTPYKVIELFAGCGGMALGFSHAGLQTELLVENNPDCVKTLTHNRPHWQVLSEDIQQIDFTPYRHQIDLVSGGFPCQSFSYAGYGKGLADTRGTLFFEFARCLSEVQPKIALAENVRGLLSHQKGRTLEIMLQALEDIHYKAAYQVIKAQFLDVPQKRERLIIIAVRKDLDLPILFPKSNDYTLSLRAALRDCPPSPGVTYNERKAAIMALVPPGRNWRDLPISLQKEYMKNSFYREGGRTGFARKLSWDEPCLTITCSPAQTQTERCHPDENRPLTVREYARVQSFPDDWQFMGSMTAQYRQIGNAVPVNMAYHLGRCLIAMLENEQDHKTMITARQWDEFMGYQLAIPGLSVG